MFVNMARRQVPRALPLKSTCSERSALSPFKKRVGLCGCALSKPPYGQPAAALESKRCIRKASQLGIGEKCMTMVCIIHDAMRHTI